MQLCDHYVPFNSNFVQVNRGYYTMMRTYEVYLRVDSLSLIGVFQNLKKNRLEKQRNNVSDIFNSEDMENISLVSRM